MENNGSIPNVSTVFRQLVKISSTNPRLNPHNSPEQFRSINNYSYSNNSYQSSGNNQNYQGSFPSSSFDNDRQKRHEALMGRLKNSLQENRQLCGVQESPVQRMNQTSFNFDRPQVSEFSGNNHYAQNQFSGFGNTGGQFKEKGVKWAPPKLKYRHIEDLEQKSTISIQNKGQNSRRNIDKGQSMQSETNLKEQFYESGLINNARTQNKQNLEKRMSKQINQSQQINAKEMQGYNRHEEEQEEENSMNHLSIMSQKPSKYSQNLESYYDICRKPVKPSALVSGSGRNDEKSNMSEKFMRKQAPKVEGINLEKAMRILSLED